MLSLSNVGQLPAAVEPAGWNGYFCDGSTIPRLLQTGYPDTWFPRLESMPSWRPRAPCLQDPAYTNPTQRPSVTTLIQKTNDSKPANRAEGGVIESWFHFATLR